MKPSRVAAVLDTLLDTRWPAFVWGAPGVGKSSVVRAVAERRKMPLVDVRAALLDPTDIRGIPAVENGRAIWCPPSFLPTEADEPGVLFFDELSAAPPLVQASLYQLTLDRRVGEYRLPDGWRIVAAGNRAEDRSISFRMPAALSNRFVHLDFELDYSDWRSWAIQNNIHPSVIAFLGVRRELLLDLRQPEKGFPTPRSWEIVSDALRRFEVAAHTSGGKEGPGRAGTEIRPTRRRDETHGFRFDDVADVLIGIVGEGAAVEYLGFCRLQFNEAKLLRILADPEREPLPTELGATYALVSYLISRAREKPVQQAAGRLLARLSPEMAVLLVNDILKLTPSFLTDPHARAFLKEHSSLLAG